MLRRRVWTGGPERDRAGDGDDVDDVGATGGLEGGEERTQAPDAAQVVDLDHFLEPPRIDRHETAARGHACVVHEQIDARMAFHDRCGHSLDVLAPADVTDLVLRAELLRKGAQPVLPPRQQDDVHLPRGEGAGDRFPDPARSPGDDGYRQTRTCRVAASVRPPASEATARKTCLPVEASRAFHEPE